MSQLLSPGSTHSLPVLPPRPFGQTNRKDLWWAFPLVTFIVFSIFIVYATWAALQGIHYHFLGNSSGMLADYISPFYSPEIFGDAKYAWLGAKPGWIPNWVPFSPAMLILWAPGGFRLTCYYYRGAYYKAFWADPISCSVGEPRKTYWGEKSLPLILQNAHRYFFYIAVIFIVLLFWDVLKATRFTDPVTQVTHFGIGVGTIILAVNVWLLGSYTFGCHSLRHLIGGRRDEISKASGACQKAYDCVSCLNKRHMVWAWCSLFSVGFADIYVRLCTAGIWHDYSWSFH